jgi:predicted alpha-1,6-mannanase (GH76 family)
LLITELHELYNKETGLWETASWWKNANVLTILIKYGELCKDESIKEIISNTFEKNRRFEVKAQNGKESWICKNYINDYYDDEGWWALVWLDAWEWTGDTRYLEMARLIFNDITTGWSNEFGGGLYWKKGMSFKGTISNSLAFTLATRLYLADTQEINGRSCLQWSIDIWKWMQDSKLINDQGLMQDGIRERNGEQQIKPNLYTYNQGVVLTGLVNLHKITGEEHYLKSANQLAKATIVHMVNEQGILKEIICEPDNCKPDSEQFKGIFMRHLAVLNVYNPHKLYKDFLVNNAKSIYINVMRKGKTLPGISWYLPSEESNVSTLSSALDVFNAVMDEYKGN